MFSYLRDKQLEILCLLFISLRLFLKLFERLGLSFFLFFLVISALLVRLVIRRYSERF